jgi:hypothetical protein
MLRISIVASLLALCASIAIAQERQWSFDQTDKDAYLVFGVPDTDDVGLSFWCTQHSGKIKIFVPENGMGFSPKQKVPLRFDVGGKTFRLTASSETNKEAGTASLEAEVPIDHPIFASLTDADRIAVRVAKRKDVFPLQDVDLSALLAVCKS